MKNNKMIGWYGIRVTHEKSICKNLKRKLKNSIVFSQVLLTDTLFNDIIISDNYQR